MAKTLIEALTRARHLIKEPYYSLPKYSTGKVAVTTGSKIVYGDGTSWLGSIKAGDTFKIKDDSFGYYTVISVESDTKLILTGAITDDTTDRTGVCVNSLDEGANPRTPFTVLEVGGSPNIIFAWNTYGSDVFLPDDKDAIVFNFTHKTFTAISKYYSKDYAEFEDVSSFVPYTIFYVLRKLMTVSNTFSGGLLYVPGGAENTFQESDVGRTLVNLTQKKYTTITAYLGPGAVRVTDNSIFAIGDKISVCRLTDSSQVLSIGSSPYGIIATDAFLVGDIGATIFNVSSQESTTITDWITNSNVIVADAIFTTGDRCVIVPAANVDSKLQVLPYTFLDEPSGTVKYIDDSFSAADAGSTVFNTDTGESTTIASITANKKVVLAANKFLSQNQGYAIASYNYEVTQGATPTAMLVDTINSSHKTLIQMLEELDENYFLASQNITMSAELNTPAYPFRKIIGFRNSAGTFYRPINIRERGNYSNLWNLAGANQAFYPYIFGNQVGIAPPSSSAGTWIIDYVPAITELRLDTDTFLLDDDYYDALCHLAATFHTTDAVVHKTADNLITLMKQTAGGRNISEPPHTIELDPTYFQ